MKKIIPITILVLIILSFTSFAQSLCFPPFPIFGKYNSNLASAEVKITVHDTRVSPTKNIVITESINSNGEYQTDLGNIDNCYFSGMTGEIVACTGSSECTFSFSVSGTKLRKDFVFTETPSGGGSSGGGGGGTRYLPNNPTPVTPFGCQQWTECKDGKQTQVCNLASGASSTESRDCVSAPVITPTPIPEPTPTPPVTPTYRCSDGSIVDAKENCPIPTKEHEEIVVNKLLSLKNTGIAGALVALSIGLYLWRRKKGKFATAEKGAKTFIDKRSK